MSLVVVLCNGVPFGGWTKVTITQSHDKCVGTAKVEFTELPGDPLPMKVGNAASVLIDGQPVITGYVHEVHGTLDERAHAINAEIRDQTQDLVDSTVGPKLRLKPPITLKQMSEKTISAMGLSIPVVDNINPEQFGLGEQMSAGIDERGHAFLDKWAEKRQVLYNTDGKGSLVIDRNRKLMAPAMLVSLFEDTPLNNVKKSTYRNSDLNRHNANAVSGQKSQNDKQWEGKSKGEATAQANPLQKHWAVANDTSVRPQRRRHHRGHQGLNGESPKKAAQWKANVAKGRGFEYKATVTGFYGAPGWLWWHGFLVPVADAHWDLEATLLIKDVTFDKDWTGGETTEVTCTYPDAHTTDEGGGAAAGQRTSKLGLGGSGAGSFPEDDGGVE